MKWEGKGKCDLSPNVKFWCSNLWWRCCPIWRWKLKVRTQANSNEKVKVKSEANDNAKVKAKTNQTHGGWVDSSHHFSISRCQLCTDNEKVKVKLAPMVGSSILLIMKKWKWNWSQWWGRRFFIFVSFSWLLSLLHGAVSTARQQKVKTF